MSSLFAADDWILIEGSGRWSGLHQVKSTGGATGILTLKTKCNLKPSAISVVVNFVTLGSYIIGNTDAAKMDIEAFKDLSSAIISPYVFINSAVDTVNSGVFSVSYPDTSGRIDIERKVVIDTDGDYTTKSIATAAETGDTVDILNMFYEEISVYEGVEVMQDESFELDLTRGQAKSIVYYLKAMQAEERQDIESREYFMSLFRKDVGRNAAARKHGVYMASGFWSMK